MRIWHPSLIPKLCQKHLCAMWREGLGAYKIITENKQGYKNHPATQEFIDCPEQLWSVLTQVRAEMLRRNYHPKELPFLVDWGGIRKEWQTLEEQITHLKSKQCACDI